MSQRNRQRRIQNREARAESAQIARQRARRQRWIFGIGGLLLAVAIVLVVVLEPFSDDGGDDTVSPQDTTTTLAAESVAGEPCVAPVDPTPEGAPAVPVKEGPPPTELVIEDLVVGEGAEVTAGATVTVNYIGVACSTGVIFDESYSGGQPVTFGLDRVITGWSEGLVGMKVGGQRLLGVPPELGYGSVGGGEDIAPDETLWFVVDVNDTQPATTDTTAAATDTTALPEE